jgi:uncharacterized lipoprotein YmbA
MMLRALVSATVLGLLLNGCNSSPPARFYTLDTQAPQGDAQWSSPVSIAVERVRVPDIVDRPQFVLRIDEAQVRVDEFARWAEPLRDQITRAIAGDLAHAFPDAMVVASPQWPEGGRLYRVAVEVQSFESAPGSAATIMAVWTVHPPADAEPMSGRSYVRVPVSTQDDGALVKAHRRALSDISADIARAIRSSLASQAAQLPAKPSKR